MDWEIGAEYECRNGRIERLIAFSTNGDPVFQRVGQVTVGETAYVSSRTRNGEYARNYSDGGLDIVRKKPKMIRLTGHQNGVWFFGSEKYYKDTHYIDINADDIKPLECKDDRRSP